MMVLSVIVAQAQTISTNPPKFTAEDPFTLTVDVTGTSLAGYTGDVFIWSWISEGCSADCDAPTNVNPASASSVPEALMTRDGSNPDVYHLEISKLTEFFSKPPSELVRIGLKLKSGDWGDGFQSDSDLFYDVEPLVFTPSVDRVFPSRVNPEDIVSLYLDQNYAEGDLKFGVGDFSISISAYDVDGNQLGSTLEMDADNLGEGVHLVRIIPTFNFDTGGTAIKRVAYTFTNKTDATIASPEFEIIFP